MTGEPRQVLRSEMFRYAAAVGNGNVHGLLERFSEPCEAIIAGLEPDESIDSAVLMHNPEKGGPARDGVTVLTDRAVLFALQGKSLVRVPLERMVEIHPYVAEGHGAKMAILLFVHDNKQGEALMAAALDGWDFDRGNAELDRFAARVTAVAQRRLQRHQGRSQDRERPARSKPRERPKPLERRERPERPRRRADRGFPLRRRRGVSYIVMALVAAVVALVAIWQLQRSGAVNASPPPFPEPTSTPSSVAPIAPFTQADADRLTAALNSHSNRVLAAVMAPSVRQAVRTSTDPALPAGATARLITSRFVASEPDMGSVPVVVTGEQRGNFLAVLIYASGHWLIQSTAEVK